MRRGIWVLGVIVLLALSSAVYDYAASSERAPELRISESEGQVTLERIEEGAVPPSVGTPLQASDRVVTGAVGRATLTLGEDTHIQVRPASSVEVVDVDEAGVSLELQGGALRATVRPDSGVVRIGNRGREVLQVHGAMEVGVDDDVFKVRAVEGEVALSGMDASRLDEGEQALVIEQHADIAPIPEELLLAVEWPESAERTRDPSVQLAGQTEPGVQVVVEGAFGTRTARADAQGNFTVEVPLVEGANPAQVRAVNALGDAVALTGVLPTRDTRAGVIRAKVRSGTP